MQQIYPPNFAKSTPTRRASLVLTLALLFGAGCKERPTTIDPPPLQPHAGAVLTVAVADPADRDLARQLARSWAARNGAEVRVLDAPYDGSADVGLIPPADLPRWAEAGQLVEVPFDRKNPSDPYRWDDVLPAYSVRLTAWRDRTYALPVVGEGMVLVYRADLFDGKDGRPARPPAAWDDLLASAKALGTPSLPPLPVGSERLLAEFFAAAACYDRPVVNRLAAGERPRPEFFVFQFDPETGTPRLDAPAFAHVAKLLQEMQPLRSRQPDAATAFRTGEAKIGILSLAELGSIGPDMSARLGIAPLPGARFTFDPKGGPKALDRDAVNRVPYLGYAGRVGVVSTKCAAPAAAWDLLADAGLPDRTALDLLADPRWGAGPYRTSQMDARARSRWYGYGLSASETERLTTALRDNLGLGIQYYRIRLRTPDHADLDAALDAHLRAAVTGTPPAGATMAKANADWKSIVDRQPRATWVEWGKKSLGF